MSQDIPVEKKFKILVQIARASHFAWHEAVAQSCPDAKMLDVVNKMWEVTAHDTAKAYIRKLDKGKPLPAQVAGSFVWSSLTMGEEAELVAGKDDKEAFVKHNGCPWFEWHKRCNLLEEDRPGCDTWFFVVVDDINKALGTNLKIETTKSLPDGDDTCVRRIWVEE